MKYKRIHITGASGAGTTTLGKGIATKMGIGHFDTDDFFWEPTDPPFRIIRKRSKKQRLLMEALRSREEWVISGSLCGWGDIAIPLFDRVVYLWVPTDIRIDRLRKRESERFGKTALSPDGNRYENHKEFMEWAAGYDTGGLDTRSRARHQEWLKGISCDIIRYEGEISIDHVVSEIFEH